MRAAGLHAAGRALAAVSAVAAVSVLAAAALSGCGGPGRAGGRGPAGRALTDIHRFEELQSRFVADSAHPRLVLLLSPT